LATSSPKTFTKSAPGRIPVTSMNRQSRPNSGTRQS
jgi:hypothetical protein